MHACTNLCINLCIGAPSVRCCPVFDTDGAVSEMATPHRTAGHPSSALVLNTTNQTGLNIAKKGLNIFGMSAKTEVFVEK